LHKSELPRKIASVVLSDSMQKEKANDRYHSRGCLLFSSKAAALVLLSLSSSFSPLLSILLIACFDSLAPCIVRVSLNPFCSKWYLPLFFFFFWFSGNAPQSSARGSAPRRTSL